MGTAIMHTGHAEVKVPLRMCTSQSAGAQRKGGAYRAPGASGMLSRGVDTQAESLYLLEKEELG